jgi:hypothetical protein
MEVTAETGIIWSFVWVISYLNPLLVQTFYPFAKSTVNISSTYLAMLVEVTLYKQAWAILTGASPP